MWELAFSKRLQITLCEIKVIEPRVVCLIFQLSSGANPYFWHFKHRDLYQKFFAARWNTTLSSKVNWPRIITSRAVCRANLVTSRSKIRTNDTLELHRVGWTPCKSEPTRWGDAMRLTLPGLDMPADRYHFGILGDGRDRFLCSPPWRQPRGK